MKQLVAIIIKFVGVLILSWIVFMVFSTAAFWATFVIACVVTVLNFWVGDLFLLPRWGNVWASIVNGIMAGIVAWVVFYTTATVPYNYMTWVYVFALVIAVAELFFHMYLFKADVVEKKSDMFHRKNLNYNTETGHELFPYSRRGAEGNLGSSVDRGYAGDSNRYGGTDYNVNDSYYNSHSGKSYVGDTGDSSYSDSYFKSDKSNSDSGSDSDRGNDDAGWSSDKNFTGHHHNKSPNKSGNNKNNKKH